MKKKEEPPIANGKKTATTKLGRKHETKAAAMLCMLFV